MAPGKTLINESRDRSPLPKKETQTPPTTAHMGGLSVHAYPPILPDMRGRF
jgi:hypothetical protein